MLTKAARTFDELWSDWQKLRESTLENWEIKDALKECLDKADTFERIRQVHEACFDNHPPDLFFALGEVRNESLDQLIDIAKNLEEAETVLTLASRKKTEGGWQARWPGKKKRAQERVDSFKQKN